MHYIITKRLNENGDKYEGFETNSYYEVIFLAVLIGNSH